MSSESEEPAAIGREADGELPFSQPFDQSEIADDAPPCASGSAESHGDENTRGEVDAAALEMMMAFQERQERFDSSNGNDGDGDGDDDGVGVNDNDDDDDDGNLHPRLAFLDQYGDLDDAHADADAHVNAHAAIAPDADDDAPIQRHPHHDNPAAVALRRHQLLQRQRQSLLRPSLLRYKPLSLLAAVALLHSTLRTRQQFYLAVTYVQSSKLAYVVLGNALLTLAVATFDAATHLFLEGGLRRNERDAIGERIRWDVTETCLALTIFRSELDVVTAVTFLALVVLKCLHWSAELRGSHLRMTEEVFAYPAAAGGDGHADDFEGERPPWYRRLPRPRFSHVRFYALLQMLLLLDVFAVAHCAVAVATDGPSVHILFGFEAAILMVSALSAMGMYHLHVVDGIVGALCHWCDGDHHYCPVGGMAAASDHDGNDDDADDADNADDDNNDNENGNNRSNDDTNDRDDRVRNDNSLVRKLVRRLADPWKDRRATFSFVIELQAQSAKFIFYVVFFAIVFTYYGMPINIFREVYVSFQQLRSRIVAFNNYRRLTHNMDKRFEDIRDEEELDRLGRTCIICRDHMDWRGGSCKKLPGCGHAFHKHCLREWMVQQQTCPTCRADIAANEARMKRREVEANADVNADVDVDADAMEVANAVAVEGDAAAEPVAEPTTEHVGDDAHDEAEQSRLPDRGDGVQTVKTATEDIPATPSSIVHSPKQSADDNGPTTETSPIATSNAPSDRRSYWQSPTQTDLHASPPAPNTATHGPNSHPHFPCLYRIVAPLGAQVFPLDYMSATTTSAAQLRRRIIPEAKLVVCLAVEYWPEPFQEVLYRIPDGFVRARDVERYLPLTVPDAAVSSVGGVGISGEGERVRTG